MLCGTNPFNPSEQTSMLFLLLSSRSKNRVLQTILNLVLTDAEIRSAIRKAAKSPEVYKRDNLRERNTNIQFDCMVRGCIGEHAITRWLGENGIEVEQTNYRPDGKNIDIDFVYKGRNLELKTSLVPDKDGTIAEAVNKRDIKLIKRSPHIEDLEGDVHMQIFYSQKRKAKDAWLMDRSMDVLSSSAEDLFHALRADRYRRDTFFVGWIDKPTLISQITALPEHQRTWTFDRSSRVFWNCKIKNARRPTELVEYLKRF